MSDNNMNEWIHLFALIKQRVQKAFLTPPFILTFIGVIMFAGSIGIWFPWFIGMTNTFLRPEGFFTYSISILASVGAEILLKDEKSKGLKLLLFIFMLISIFCLIFDLSNNKSVTYLSFIGAFIALAIWFIINANDEKYDDTQSPNNPIGGDITDPNGLQGEGLK